MYVLSTRFDAVLFVPLALALSSLSAGCSSPGKGAEGAPVTGSSSAAEQCDYVNYHHDEAKNDGGAGHCSTDCDCDGMRSCTGSTCQGTARPATSGPESCNNKAYRWNEAWNTGGPGHCATDCECDGLRTCTSGACTGTAR